MAANVDIEKLFLRLFMFSHKISLPVVRTFFVSSVLGQSHYNNDIVTFFEHHKHEIFHLMGDYKCCECTLLPPLQSTACKTRLEKDQFKKMYDTGLSQPGHFTKGSRGRVFQQCLCCISVKKDTNPKNYDITLLLTILLNCGQLSDNHKFWLDTIRKCRNWLCHLTDITHLTENEIRSLWAKLECSILQLADEIPPRPNYKECIETQIEILKDADYSWNTVTPIMEAMESKIISNINGIIQKQISAEEDLNSLKTTLEQLTQNFSVKMEDVIHVIQKLHFDIGIEIKSLNKGNGKSSKENDPSGKPSTSVKENSGEDSDIEKVFVELKINTPGALGEKEETIKQFFQSAVDMINLVEPFEIKFVRNGCINIGTLLPAYILNNEEELKRVICHFLDQMVIHCDIDASIPLDVKVKITVFDNEQKGDDTTFLGPIQRIDNETQTVMIDSAVQAVPTMVDQNIETMEIGISQTYHDPENWTAYPSQRVTSGTRYLDNRETFDVYQFSSTDPTDPRNCQIHIPPFIEERFGIEESFGIQESVGILRRNDSSSYEF